MNTTSTIGNDLLSGQGGVRGPVRIGSEDHKELFCRMFLDTYDPYKPAVIDWPRLDPEAWQRLTSLTFWQLAVTTEGKASSRMQAMADVTEDPLIKKALALNAFEEQRHKDVLENMIRFYSIEIDAEPLYLVPPNPELAYLRIGYGECFDSFFAFGLFKLAQESGFFPPELVEVFEPVIQEEARHILFFVNWLAYTRAHEPFFSSVNFMAKCVCAVCNRVLNRLNIARSQDNNTELAVKGHKDMGIDISPRGFMELCLQENERRMARYDARLLRPQLVPRLVRAALPFVGRKG